MDITVRDERKAAALAAAEKSAAAQLAAQRESVMVRQGQSKGVLIACNTAIALCTLLLFIIFAVSGEAVVLVMALFFLAITVYVAAVSFFMVRADTRDVFTPLCVMRLANGKFPFAVYWNTVDGISWEAPASAEIYSEVRGVLTIVYTVFFDDRRKEVCTFSCRCTKAEAERIQAIIPVAVRGLVRSPQKEREIEEIENKFQKYYPHPLFDFSIRARVAWLICCLEAVWEKFSPALTAEEEELLGFLWQFTSCRATEEEAAALKEMLRAYREENEAFPEFAPEEVAGMRSVDDWLAEAERRLAGFSAAEEGTERSADGAAEKRALTAAIFRSVYAVALHTPPRDFYPLSECLACVTLDEADRVKALLEEHGIVPPEVSFTVGPKFALSGGGQLFSLLSDGSRDPAYGIGLAFNGQESYSRFLGHAAARGHAPSGGEEPVREGLEEYDLLEEVLAPTLEESAQNSYHVDMGYKTPASTRRMGICGGILSAVFLALYIVACALGSEEAAAVCCIVGGCCAVLGAWLLFVYFKERRIYRMWQGDPHKWFFAALLVLCTAAYAAVGLHACGHAETFSPFGYIYSVLVCAAAVLCAAEMCCTFCTERKITRLIITDMKNREESRRENQAWRPPFPLVRRAVGGGLLLVAFALYIVAAVLQGGLPLCFAAAAAQFSGMALWSQAAEIEEMRDFSAAEKRTAAILSVLCLVSSLLFLILVIVLIPADSVLAGYWWLLRVATLAVLVVWSVRALWRTARRKPAPQESTDDDAPRGGTDDGQTTEGGV